MAPSFTTLGIIIMIIIGAGLTGCIAAHIFPNSQIHEYLEVPKVHKALLRFRSDAVSSLTGIPFKKVKVYKGVYKDCQFINPSIRDMNHYSRKVSGGIYDRSIGNLDPDVRYIAPYDFHQQLLERLSSRIVYGSSASLVGFAEPVISTLPLPVLLRKVGREFSYGSENKLDSSPIYVTTLNVSDCESFQTIYYPGQDTKVYRASLTGDKLIIESIERITYKDVKYVISSFGLAKDKCCGGPDFSDRNVEQTIGKFVPLEENYRRELMYTITNEHGIYSLGRHATWRKVLLDDIVNDCHRILSMINTSQYDKMIGKMK